jgi:hypothetical protein
MTLAAWVPYLNNRDEAVIFFLGVAALLALCSKSVRTSTGYVLGALVHPKVSGLLAVVGAYSAAVLWLLEPLGFWDRSMIKEAVLWFVGTAFVALLNAPDADEHFVRVFSLRAVKIAVFIEFFVNLYVFPVYVEVWLVPLMVFSYGMVAFAEVKNEETVRYVMESFLTLIGAMLLIFVTVSAVTDFSHFASLDTLRHLLVAPLLTLAFVPFLYLVALAMAYGQVFIRVGFALREDGGEPDTPATVRFSIIRRCGLSLTRINRFASHVVPRMFATPSQVEARQLIRTLR